MPLYELDHVTLGVRHLYAACDRLRDETGLESYEGGWQRFIPTAHRIVPLPGDAYINVESVIDHQALLPPPAAAFRRWFDDTLGEGDDHWMTWCLRTKSYEDLEGIARRFGTDIAKGEGAIRPDGAVGARVMAPDGIFHTWAKGLPNWYFHADMSVHPSRRHPAEHREPLQEIAWLEVGGEPAELEQHLGGATFENLPLRFVDRPTGLYGLGITTAGGNEVALRRRSGAPALATIAAGLHT